MHAVLKDKTVVEMHALILKQTVATAENVDKNAPKVNFVKPESVPAPMVFYIAAQAHKNVWTAKRISITAVHAERPVLGDNFAKQESVHAPQDNLFAMVFA